MRLFLFLSALLAALTGSAANARTVAPQEVAASRDMTQAAAHVAVIAAAVRPVAGRVPVWTGGAALRLPRTVPLYQDRLRE